MTGTTHITGGLLTGMLIMQRVDIPGEHIGKVILVTGVVLGSLLPDLDHRRSTIRSKWEIAGCIYDILSWMVKFVAIFLPRKPKRYLRRAVGVRGFLHWPSLYLLVLCIAVLPGTVILQKIPLEFVEVYRIFICSLVIGAGSHLVLDTFSDGIPLLAPFNMERVPLANIKTGGLWEAIFFICEVAAVLALVVKEFGMI